MNATITRITGRRGLLSAEQVAVMLRVSPATVRRWGRGGLLTAVRTCGSCNVVAFREADVRALLRDGTQERTP